MYKVIESKHWLHTSGRTASIYGAVPYTSESDKKNWKIVMVGYTVKNTRTGIVGVGRKPDKKHEDAQALADRLNKMTSVK